MTDSGRNQEGRNQPNLECWRDPENDALARELDAALAVFAAVEPRAGLDDRVLANLRSQPAHAGRSWWRWPAVAALTAVIVVTVILAWRSERPIQQIASLPTATSRINQPAGAQGANNERSGANQLHDDGYGRQLKPHAVSHSVRTVGLRPKLDQFPSPQPLSEQEKILARYIANFPEHAALIAQARTEELLRDSAEETNEAASRGNGNSQ